jgi:hypothetical protein
MVEQIAQDASLYLVPGSKFDMLIPFIWDDSRRTAHHEAMVQGHRQIAGVADAVIVPRPGSMALPEAGQTNGKPKWQRTRLHSIIVIRNRAAHLFLAAADDYCEPETSVAHPYQEKRRNEITSV